MRPSPLLLAMLFVITGCGRDGSTGAGTLDPNPDSTSADIREAGLAVAAAFDSLEAGSFPGYRALIERANRLRPHHPTLRIHAARAALLTGDTLAAVETLTLLADMGMAITIARDDVLTGAAAHPSIAPVVERFIENGRPIVVSDTILSIDDPDVQPEGIARRNGLWYIGSVHGNRVLEVERDGHSRVLTDAIFSGMGLAVHRNRLWIATTSTAEGGYAQDEEGRSEAVVVSIPEGVIQARFAAPDDTLDHWFGDLAIGPDGTVYVSDSRAPGIYVVRAGAVRVSTGDMDNGPNGTSARVSPLVAGGPFTSPQGLALDANGARLFVADYSAGIFVVDPETGHARLMSQPADETLLGIDGLAWHDSSLLAVQNGTSPTRVLRLTLGEDGRSIRAVEILESNHPAHDDPTLVFVENDSLFYVANSQWPKFAPGGHAAGRTGPVILGMPLR